jgi:hypothetical protein
MRQGGESDGDGSPKGEGLVERSSASIRIDSTPSQHARAVGAWRSWLEALAIDAEAALAAAMTYAALPPEGRDAWLDALERDRGLVEVPPVALYAPLVAVEAEEQRKARIVHAMGVGPLPVGAFEGRALRGATASGDCVCAVATPIYLDFVELLVCRYDPERGVFAAHHDPFGSFRSDVHVSSLVASALDEAVTLVPARLRDVIEELAHAVVADRREGRDPPEALARFSHLFGPDLEAGVGGSEGGEEASSP